MTRATLRIVTTDGRRLTVTVRPPWRIARDEDAPQDLVRRVLSALGIERPADEPRDLWTLDPWIHPISVLATLFGKTADELRRDKILRAHQSRAVSDPAFALEGRVLVAMPLPGEPGVFYGVSEVAHVPSRTLQPEELTLAALDLVALGRHVASALFALGDGARAARRAGHRGPRRASRRRGDGPRAARGARPRCRGERRGRSAPRALSRRGPGRAGPARATGAAWGAGPAVRSAELGAGSAGDGDRRTAAASHARARAVRRHERRERHERSAGARCQDAAGDARRRPPVAAARSPRSLPAAPGAEPRAAIGKEVDAALSPKTQEGAARKTKHSLTAAVVESFRASRRKPPPDVDDLVVRDGARGYRLGIEAAIVGDEG